MLEIGEKYFISFDDGVYLGAFCGYYGSCVNMAEFSYIDHNGHPRSVLFSSDELKECVLNGG